jgi:hypothetical protein
MVNVTDIGQSVPMGSPMDPMDHEADSGHNSSFNPGRVQMAGDVLPFPDKNLNPATVNSANANSMANIAKGGAKAVDIKNLAIYPRK